MAKLVSIEKKIIHFDDGTTYDLMPWHINIGWASVKLVREAHADPARTVYKFYTYDTKAEVYVTLSLTVGDDKDEVLKFLSDNLGSNSVE